MKRATDVFIFTLLAIVATMAVGVLIYAYTVTRTPPDPPLKYTKKEYTPERGFLAVYNPGETLVYTAALTVKQDGALEVVRGFRDEKYGRSLLCDGTIAKNIVLKPEDQPAPFPPEAVGNDVEGQIRIVVPDLRPGLHWATSSVYKVATGGEAVTTVRFRVTRPCPSG